MALIGLLVNKGFDNNPDLSFKIGFTALLLSVGFAIIQAIVVASLDIGGIRKSLEESVAFRNVIARKLAEVKTVKFGSNGKKEFENSAKTYSEYLKTNRNPWHARLSGVVGFLLNVSLITAITGLAVYYGSIVWK